MNEIYERADDDLKDFIDNCRIRSFIQGTEIKRDYTKPFDKELKNFPIKTVERKEDGNKIVKPLLGDGISQVEVSAATKFKNPYLKPTQWLHNNVEMMEAAVKAAKSGKNDGHSDDEGEIPLATDVVPMLHHQQSLGY